MTLIKVTTLIKVMIAIKAMTPTKAKILARMAIQKTIELCNM